MAKPLVVLADPDAGYLAPLEYRFLSELGDVLELAVITDASYYAEFLMSPHDIDTMLVSEAWYDASLGAQNIAHLLVLVEDQGRDRTRIMSAEYTFKYSSLNIIFNKVLSMSSRLHAKDDEGDETKVLLFFSPVGGAGCTTMALGVAAALQAEYKRVLYVDAEYMQTFKCFLKDGKTAPNSMARDMARLAGDTYQNLSEYIENGAFDYLPPLRAGLTAFGIEYEFFARFVSAVRDAGAYDYIVVDTDSVFNDEKADLFAVADHVVVAVEQSQSSRYKALRLLDNLDSTSGEKYHFICNKYKPDIPDAFAGSESTLLELDGYVGYLEGREGLDAADLGYVEDMQQVAHLVV